MELSKVSDLMHKHVFVYQRNPVKEVKTAYRTACRRAGIDNLRFHDLRHCAATNLRRAGIDTTTAMQTIGHKSPLMWKRYNSVAESDLLAAANKLNTHLSNTLNNTCRYVCKCLKVWSWREELNHPTVAGPAQKLASPAPAKGPSPLARSP